MISSDGKRYITDCADYFIKLFARNNEIERIEKRKRGIIHIRRSMAA
jgi:hypothetical protein